MTTLDNINENVSYKINIIENMISIIYEELDILNIYNSKNSSILEKNIEILNNKKKEIEEKIQIYEVGSSLFLTNYYNIINNNVVEKINNSNNIYNDSIFLVNSSNSPKLESIDLLELKKIY